MKVHLPADLLFYSFFNELHEMFCAQMRTVVPYVRYRFIVADVAFHSPLNGMRVKKECLNFPAGSTRVSKNTGVINIENGYNPIDICSPEEVVRNGVKDRERIE